MAGPIATDASSAPTAPTAPAFPDAPLILESLDTGAFPGLLGSLQDTISELRLAPGDASGSPRSALPLTTEEINAHLESQFLRPDPTVPHHWLPNCQRLWEREPDYAALLSIPSVTSTTTLELVRDPVTLAVNGTAQVTHIGDELTAQNSVSFARAAGKATDYVRGAATGVPFAPGGLAAPSVDALAALVQDADPFGDQSLFEGNLLSIPPGFDRGLNLADSTPTVTSTAPPTTYNLLDLLRSDDIPLLPELPVEETEEEKDENVKGPEEKSASPPPALDTADVGETTPLDALLPTDDYHPATQVAPAATGYQRQWAHEIDVSARFDNFAQMVPVLAHDYPFELDTFQKQAVYHLEQGHSVFVAAHTSAGKTAVAEYAVSLSLKHMTKTIYTSPIKALSNQKFRDFRTTFGDDNVGILTGDIQIQPEAPCLIMTTEILRSMLYHGADLIRDVEFVVFDEVHYVNDAERGVVWEEVIIMLPEHVALVLLSATIPNTREFAEWVGRTKRRDVYVISTAHRPVPLEHFLYVDQEAFKIVDAQRNFLNPGYRKAQDALTGAAKREQQVWQRNSQAPAPNAHSAASRPRGPVRAGAAPLDRSLWSHLVGFLRKRELTPAIVFAFSRRRCEEYAAGLGRNNSLNTATERREVHRFAAASLLRLRPADRSLPQILRITEQLERGVGVHHGGLLPIVKELVELLFARGLVKILFATETFAMGVNMPARAVVFSTLRKHDGHGFRDLLPGEYTQMAGRAGRRGLDKTGVVLVVGAGASRDGMPDAPTLQRLILGPATRLSSQFRLTYPMILSLLRVEALQVEDMIKRSFAEDRGQRALPARQQLLTQSETQLAAVPPLDCVVCDPSLTSFYAECQAIAELRGQVYRTVASSTVGSGAWGAGRVVVVATPGRRPALGVVLRQDLDTTTSAQYRLTCLVFRRPAAEESEAGWSPQVDGEGGNDETDAVTPPRYPFIGWAAALAAHPLPLDANHPGTPIRVDDSQVRPEVVSIGLADLAATTSESLRLDLARLLGSADRATATAQVQSALAKLQTDQATTGVGWAEYDWGARVRDLDFQLRLQSLLARQAKLTSFDCIACPDFVPLHYRQVHHRTVLATRLHDLRFALSDQNLDLIPDYEQRLEVLRRLRCIDSDGGATVQLKGRVACEINAADALVLTELILDNVLADFTGPEIAALLSCFIFQDRHASPPYLVPSLARAKDCLVAAARKVAQVQADCGVVETFDHNSGGGGTGGDEDVPGLCFGLMEVVYEWARGMTFQQITDLTDIQEGIIVRAIIRLDEACREVKLAARTVGDSVLYQKMEEVATLIKRDIVFTASLYY
ncbi:Antiviral helicase ski2 [Tieghemiomyces parasiticus]|uniref:Antiviral helicase ski2 n=2 Tax=Tieghemiomyces parasiticus TaxID=78921 RepID=A0A9W8A604_9FUNG|nr:Antiviral helicase ski2 [Tieghemiomyces parasiticus]